MIKNIFSVPIFTTILDASIANEVENLVVPRLNLLNQVKTTHTDFFSENRIVAPKEIFNLLNKINIIAEEYCIQTNIFKGNNINYWIQDYQKNDQHEIHAHPNSFLSGVYYIRANKNSGDLVFHNPNPHMYFSKYQNINNLEKYCTYKIKPHKGLLVLFPHWLFHQALPSIEKNTVRTCLAFNYIK